MSPELIYIEVHDLRDHLQLYIADGYIAIPEGSKNSDRFGQILNDTAISSCARQNPRSFCSRCEYYSVSFLLPLIDHVHN